MVASAQVFVPAGTVRSELVTKAMSNQLDVRLQKWPTPLTPRRPRGPQISSDTICRMLFW
jgi:hypothetical protein